MSNEYHYFVAFCFWASKNGNAGFGRTLVTMDHQVQSVEDIEGIEAGIREKLNLHKVVVLNWKRL